MTGRVGGVKGYYVFYIACVQGVGWYMYMYTVGEAVALYTVDCITVCVYNMYMYMHMHVMCIVKPEFVNCCEIYLVV